MKKGKAKYMIYESGKIVVEPYDHSDTPRYEPLLDLEYGSLTTTKSNYRLLLNIPRKKGIMECVKHLLHDATQAGKFMTNLYINSDE